jgi:hypothetical protein
MQFATGCACAFGAASGTGLGCDAACKGGLEHTGGLVTMCTTSWRTKRMDAAGGGREAAQCSASREVGGGSPALGAGNKAGGAGNKT